MERLFRESLAYNDKGKEISETFRQAVLKAIQEAGDVDLRDLGVVLKNEVHVAIADAILRKQKFLREIEKSLTESLTLYQEEKTQ
jgi:hypothetical protein